MSRELNNPLVSPPPILSLPLLPATQAFLSFSPFFSSHCVSVCVGSTHNPFSLPRFLLSSFGDGPRNLTGTPPLGEPSTAALVASGFHSSLDRFSRSHCPCLFGRLGWFLIPGRGGIRRAVWRRPWVSWSE